MLENKNLIGNYIIEFRLKYGIIKLEEQNAALHIYATLRQNLVQQFKIFRKVYHSLTERIVKTYPIDSNQVW